MYLFTSHHCIFYEVFVPALSSTSICFHLNLLLKQIYSETIPSLQLKTLTLKCWDFINSLMMRKRPAKPNWSKLISQEGKQLGSKRQRVPWQDWLKYHVGRQLFPWLLFARTDLICVRVCVHLFIQSLVVFKQRLQGFEDLHLAGDSRWWGCLSLHHCHPQTAFVTRHQTLQVLQQQLQRTHKHKYTHKCMHDQR